MVALDLAQLGRVGELEEGRREFNEPLGIDDRHFAHVLFSRLDQLVVDNPFGLAIEDGAGRMDVNHLAVHQCAIAFLRIFLCRIAKEAGADGLLNAGRVLAGRDNV